MNVAPSPGSLTTPALPPCASAIAATMAKPSPVPFPSSVSSASWSRPLAGSAR